MNDEIGFLVIKLQDGVLDPAERARLRELILSDRACRERIVEQLVLSAGLREQLSNSVPSRALSGAPSRRSWIPTGLVLRAAAVLLIGLPTLAVAWLCSLYLLGDVGEGFARVTYQKDAIWQGRMPEIGKKVAAGELELLSGMTRLEFENGATIAVSGPALFRIEGPGQARIDRGRLVAFVPESAVGFVVQTQELTVVDLGTAFGVNAEPGAGTNVCVFEGRVQITDGLFAEVSVSAGEAYEKAKDQAALSQIDYRPADYDLLWSLTSGIVDARGPIRIVSPGPDSTRLEPNDERIFVLSERLDARVPGNLNRVLANARDHDVPLWNSNMGTASLSVRSYLFQFDPATVDARKRSINGSVTFDAPIVGIIAGSGLLTKTDPVFSSGDSVVIEGRGAELKRSPQNPGRVRDSIRLLNENRTIEVNFYARTDADQLRVLVQRR